ncbi:hypothetical protein [Nocardia sp. NPDC051570]|uniref:hypothetical protein n=1 Tax=Nocardia sp. NPDC051570 TaxID=3364324 RepID=UPI0037936242
MTEREAEVLNELLSADFVGAQQLKAQLPLTRVVATWGEGSPSVDLEVEREAERADIADGEIPVDAQVRDVDGNYTGEITVWTNGGYLSAIEYGWVTDDRPDSLPAPSLLTLVV